MIWSKEFAWWNDWTLPFASFEATGSSWTCGFWLLLCHSEDERERKTQIIAYNGGSRTLLLVNQPYTTVQSADYLTGYRWQPLGKVTLYCFNNHAFYNYCTAVFKLPCSPNVRASLLLLVRSMLTLASWNNAAEIITLKWYSETTSNTS